MRPRRRSPSSGTPWSAPTCSKPRPTVPAGAVLLATHSSPTPLHPVRAGQTHLQGRSARPDFGENRMAQAGQAISPGIGAARRDGPAGQTVLGLARRRAVLRLRPAVPDPADALSDGRRVPGRRRRISRSTNIAQPLTPHDPQRLPDQPPGQPRLGAPRRAASASSLAYAVVHGRRSALAPADRRDLLGRRLELRRHPARLCLPCDARARPGSSPRC